MSEMKAARLHAIGDFRVDTVPVPQVSGKELLVNEDVKAAYLGKK